MRTASFESVATGAAHCRDTRARARALVSHMLAYMCGVCGVACRFAASMTPMGATSSGRPCVACLMQQQQTPWAAACAGAKGLPPALHSHSSLLHMQHMLSAGLLSGTLTLPSKPSPAPFPLLVATLILTCTSLFTTHCSLSHRTREYRVRSTSTAPLRLQ